MKPKKTGGGWAAIRYTLRMAHRVGWWRLWKALSARNACKTCALGMGGQAGGMRNEAGHWPEVCKKSLQAMVADMQQGLRPEFFESFSLAQLNSLSPRELEWCGRLTTPVYAGPRDTHYRQITWDQALERIAHQLRSSLPDENFFYASGRSSNEAGFLLQLFSRVYGTNFVNNCSFYCHQASGVGLGESVGSSTATVALEDVEGADLFFLIGGNPASNHPRLMRTLMNIRRNGGHVIVINPVREVGLVNFSVPSDVRSLFFGSKIADLYIQPHIGGDMALLLGIAKVVLAIGAIDKAYIEHATEGFDTFVKHVEALNWTDIEHGSGVSRDIITKAAEVYCQARHAIFAWTMGITHHLNGVANVQTIVNLALMRGMVGRPHCGLMPIRGHSNVQGMGSVGVVPNLKEKVLANLETHLKIHLPRTPGLDTMACMHAAEQGTIRSAFCLGGNLYGSNPDSKFAKRALWRLELVTYLNTSLNTTHTHGRGKETIILPVLARDEESQPTTQESMFSFVRLSDGGPARLQGPRGEVDIIASLAGRVLGEKGPIQWSRLKQHRSIREIIARVVPGFEEIAALEQTKREFHVCGRILHEPLFATPTGKARFTVHSLRAAPAQDDSLRMMTLRSEGQFNTVVYEEEDIYRGQDRRDVILMNRQDIERLGFEVNQPVTVRSATGIMSPILVRAYDIRAGNAIMYYPEANVLVSTETDPRSKTPAFKCVSVTLEPIAAGDSSANGHQAAKLDSGRVPLQVTSRD
ncbi:MAG TPA: FdhF/YdeP family oxidoreductase [Gemmataceae bacterium]|jgi:molybdopterin-dependent oxidoreductase alpha subunit|nr:FdhF/YdeP family oxidoreductase [Gemmataceae bacterium]